MTETRKVFNVTLGDTEYTVLAKTLSGAITEVLSWYSLDIDDEYLRAELKEDLDEKITDDDGSEMTLSEWIKENIKVSDNAVIIGNRGN